MFSECSLLFVEIQIKNLLLPCQPNNLLQSSTYFEKKSGNLIYRRYGIPSHNCCESKSVNTFGIHLFLVIVIIITKNRQIPWKILVGKGPPPNFASNIQQISIPLKSSNVPLSGTLLTKKSDKKMVIASVNPHHVKILQI